MLISQRPCFFSEFKTNQFKELQLDKESDIAGNQEPRINEQIRANEVRLVSPDGEQIGITPLSEALEQAREIDLDLVEVAENASPPVCRIMDYGKYKYEAAQRAKDSRKKSTNIVVKELKYRPKIARGDFDTKTSKVRKFLEDGHKVKLTIMFRGREVQHPELGRRILDEVSEQMEDIAVQESYPQLDGRNMVMVLSPDKKAIENLRKAKAQSEKDNEA
ncbi:MAG: translation initiation factor IF-3 [Actinomycetota bacterium]